jgi:ppGpp synthetase/RelA/SpoT-type nucleotidyltranferase
LITDPISWACQTGLGARAELHLTYLATTASDEGIPETEFLLADDYPRFEFSKKDVKRAGRVIAANEPFTPEREERIRDAFRIANGWRDAHAYPMDSVRRSVILHLAHAELEGVTAARLKRMPAISGKLRRVGLGLDQLQDLAGCRCIMPDLDSIGRFVSALRERLRHPIQREDNYIAQPKSDGYRSHHLIISFKHEHEASAYDGRKVELQVRTRLQHAWATTVEAVGLFRNENLKNHKGSPEWLGLFALASAAMAEAEGCALHQEWPKGHALRSELKTLARRLDALGVLERVRLGVQGTTDPLDLGYHPSHYLIRFDLATKTVRVEPHNRIRSATISYDKAEEEANLSNVEGENVVLVNVDTLESLKSAYPNYFGDVEVFEGFLRKIVKGRKTSEFAHLPVARRPPEREPVGDLSWLRRSPFAKPGSGRK